MINYELIKKACGITGGIQDLAQEIIEIPQEYLYNENTLKDWLNMEVCNND